MREIGAWLKRQGKETLIFVHLVLQSFLKGGCLVRASALTYTTLLTFVPFLLTIFFIIRCLPISDQVGVNVHQFIILNFVPDFGDQILSHIMLFEKQAEALPRLSFFSLGITVMILLITVENTINDSWLIRKKRKISASIVINWLILLIGPILLFASIIVSSILSSFEWFNIVHLIGQELSIQVIPFGLSILAFSLLYYVVPHCKLSFPHALAGGAVAAILFECAKKGVSFYFYYVKTYSVLYGALAALPFLMIWVYIVWVIFFLGSHVVNVLRQYANFRKRPAISLVDLL